MVQAGQYLERPALVVAEGATLEALYHRGTRPPALLLCPPLRGPGMDEPLLAEIAWAAARDGRAALRFQHRGRGASQTAIEVAERGGLGKVVLADPDVVPVLPPGAKALVLLPEAGGRVGPDAAAA